jgi:hypothetical protein
VVKAELFAASAEGASAKAAVVLRKFLRDKLWAKIFFVMKVSLITFGLIDGWNLQFDFRQGLKPISFPILFGTTEVVP